MIEGLAEVTYFVKDLAAYASWMEEALGATVMYRADTLIQCRVAGVVVTIHPTDEKNPSGPGGQVVYWRVSDMPSAVAYFERQGCRRWRGPIEGIDGPMVAQMQDSWGNLWGLLADGEQAHIVTKGSE